MVYSIRRSPIATTCHCCYRTGANVAALGSSVAETLIKTERNNFKEVVRSGQIVTQPVRSQDEARAESWSVLVDKHNCFWRCRKKDRAHRSRRDRRT